MKLKITGFTNDQATRTNPDQFLPAVLPLLDITIRRCHRFELYGLKIEPMNLFNFWSLLDGASSSRPRYCGDKTGHARTNLLYRKGGDVRQIIIVHSIAIVLGFPRRNAFPDQSNVSRFRRVV